MKSYLYKILIINLIFIVALNLKTKAQKVNIPDDAFFNIKSSTLVTVNDDINIGSGNSGTLHTAANLLKVTGIVSVASGADLNIAGGTLNFGSINLNINSYVSYSGENQTTLDYEYGNLRFCGTGTMNISGENATPTTCNNLIVKNTGNKMKIPANKALTVSNSITNEAGTSGIEVASDVSGDGSLIFNGSGADGTVKRHCPGYQYHYLSPGVNNSTVGAFPTSALLWNAALNWTGVGDYTPWQYASGTLSAGAGYAFYSANNTVSFSGEMNVGQVVQTLYFNSEGTAQNEGWNLVGNPYTSAIDWDEAVANGAVPVGAENAIYFFEDNDASASQTNYRYYVPSTGGTYGIGTADGGNIIPMGQGFFIKTNTDNVNLVFQNSCRVHNTKSLYKSDPTGILKLEVEGNNKTDQVVFRIVDDASLNFDARFDARKLFATNEEIPQIYSLSQEENANIAINSIPEIKGETIIPLGLKAIEGSYKISLLENSIYGVDMYFVDAVLNIKFNLNNSFTYVYDHKGGEITDRFYIQFGSKDSESEDDTDDTDNTDDETTYISETSQPDIVIYPNPIVENIYIRNLVRDSQVVVSDMYGRILHIETAKTEKMNINASLFSAGVYNIDIVQANKHFSKKVIKK